MHTENEINLVTSEKITGLKLSISNLRDELYVINLKEDLKQFVFDNAELHDNYEFLKKEIISDAPSWLINANFSRTQSDLIGTSNSGEEYIFYNFFNNYELPSVLTENGLLLNGNLLNILAGPLAPGQYVQASGAGALSIGEVSSLSGTAKATRLDGNEFVLSNGDPVFQGDTIKVFDSGAVGLTFLDKTTLSLSEGGMMVLDELVYDPTTGNGSMAVDMVEGAFSFISGEIAKNGLESMTIKTPVATVGIRGTTVAGKAAVEGNENSFTLLQDADGGVGEISVSNAGGTQVLAQVGATTSITSFNTPPPPPIILSAAQIQANYGTALNVLPPTPAVAPSPQEAPPPQEEEQAVQEEAAEETSDEVEEEASEEVSEEEQASEEVEEAIEEEELAEAEESLPEEEVISEEGLPEGEEGTPPEGEQVVAEEETPPPEGDQQAAQEAFDTALAAGASPEQAMAEAAAAGGIDEPEPGGQALDSELLGEPDGLQLGGDPLRAPIPGGSSIDTLGGAIFTQTLVTGTGPLIGSTLEPLNFGSSPIVGPVFGMGPAFGPGMMDAMGQGPMSGLDPFMQGAAGFGDPSLGLDLYGLPEIISTEDYFFEDPSFYDDFNKTEDTLPLPTNSSNTSNTINGTNVDDTIDKSSETNSMTINGLDGDDTIIGGTNNDVIDGGNGIDSITGKGGDDILSGGTGNDIIHGNNGNDKIMGDEGDDVLKGGDGNDVIVGGVGDDTLSGNNGGDMFYYNPNDVDGSSKDIILDFGDGDDSLVASEAPSSAYNRKQIHTDATQIGSNYDITINSNELPYVFNFTYDVPTATADNTTGIANHLTGFSISVSATGASLATDESMYIAVGDGTDTYIYFWTDTNNHHGMIAESELDPVVKLSNFNNDNLDGSEFSFQTISGV